MESGKIAGAAAQRCEGLGAAPVRELHAQRISDIGQIAQLCQREIVAGMHAYRRRLTRDRLVQRVREFGREVVELGGEARLRTLAGPEQFGPERAQLGAATPRHAHERSAEERRPVLDEVPCVPVGDSGAARRNRQLAVLLERFEKREQRQIELARALRVEAPHGPDVDADGRSHAGDPSGTC